MFWFCVLVRGRLIYLMYTFTIKLFGSGRRVISFCGFSHVRRLITNHHLPSVICHCCRRNIIYFAKVVYDIVFFVLPWLCPSFILDLFPCSFPIECSCLRYIMLGCWLLIVFLVFLPLCDCVFPNIGWMGVDRSPVAVGYQVGRILFVLIRCWFAGLMDVVIAVTLGCPTMDGWFGQNLV